jgi:zeta-carotene desaturase
MLDWLRLHGQSQAAVERFWSAVLVSALNEELSRTDARYGLDVLWKAFLSTRSGYRLGIPIVPLGELYGGCRAAIEKRGGQVALRTQVRSLRLQDGRIAAAITAMGGEQPADFFVLAVPHDLALGLLPMPMASRPEFASLKQLKASPITGVHFWFDRDILAEPFMAVLGCTTQWVFNKTRLYGKSGGRYVQLVISACYSLLSRSRQEIIDICLNELRAIVPEARRARLMKAVVVKEAAATFSPEPGSDRWRPAQTTPIANLFLAGDWTKTGWPATMEGAVRSGYLAAEAISAATGAPRRFLRSDLPVEGLARLWARP